MLVCVRPSPRLEYACAGGEVGGNVRRTGADTWEGSRLTVGGIAAEIVQASKIVCRADVAIQAEQIGEEIVQITKIERREEIVERKVEQVVAVTDQGALVLIQKRLIQQPANQVGEQKIAATPVLYTGM